MNSFLTKLKESQQREPALHIIDTVKKNNIYTIDISSQVNNSQVLDRIYEYKDKFPISRTSSIENAWHSDYFFHNHVPDLDVILLNTIEKYIREFYAPKNTYDLILLSSWPIIYQKGSHVNRHNHGVSALSGVYYVQTGTGSQPLVFSPSEHTIHPKEGMLVLFPGDLYHYVPVQKVEGTRISIAFNYAFNIKLNSGIVNRH